jgi:hypothetical protein
MNFTLRKAAVAAVVAWPLASSAGGIYLYEIGTSDLGFAAAGTAARAEDASTLFANPAGMTRLTGDQMTLGAQALYGDAEYKLDGQGILTGSDPGNVIGWFPGGSAFYSHSVSDRLKVGIGAYGNFGLALDFGDSWAGKNLVGEMALMAMTIQPTAAYRLDEQWSVGAGLTANYRRPQRPEQSEATPAAALRGQGAGGARPTCDHPDRRPRLRRHQHLRRPDRHAHARPPRQGRPALQQLPHHRALLAHARRAEVRAQPPHLQHGLHHRDGDRLPRRHRRDPQRRGPAGRDAAPQRLQHRRLRQVARDRRLGGQRLRPLRPLADAPGLRQVLRLHRRRDQPVGALPL